MSGTLEKSRGAHHALRLNGLHPPLLTLVDRILLAPHSSSAHIDEHLVAALATANAGSCLCLACSDVGSRLAALSACPRLARLPLPRAGNSPRAGRCGNSHNRRQNECFSYTNLPYCAVAMIDRARDATASEPCTYIGRRIKINGRKAFSSVSAVARARL